MLKQIGKIEVEVVKPETTGTFESSEYIFTAYDVDGEVIEEYRGAEVAMILSDLNTSILNRMYCEAYGIPYV